MDDESAVKLLPGGSNRKLGQYFLNFENENILNVVLTESRAKKVQHGKAANALFFGVVLGFIFSFLFAYSGIMDENNNVDYSIYDFMSK